MNIAGHSGVNHNHILKLQNDVIEKWRKFLKTGCVLFSRLHAQRLQIPEFAIFAQTMYHIYLKLYAESQTLWRSCETQKSLF